MEKDITDSDSRNYPDFSLWQKKKALALANHLSPFSKYEHYMQLRVQKLQNVQLQIEVVQGYKFLSRVYESNGSGEEGCL